MGYSTVTVNNPEVHTESGSAEWPSVFHGCFKSNAVISQNNQRELFLPEVKLDDGKLLFTTRVKTTTKL